MSTSAEDTVSTVSIVSAVHGGGQEDRHQSCRRLRNEGAPRRHAQRRGRDAIAPNACLQTMLTVLMQTSYLLDLADVLRAICRVCRTSCGICQRNPRSHVCGTFVHRSALPRRLLVKAMNGDVPCEMSPGHLPLPSLAAKPICRRPSRALTDRADAKKLNPASPPSPVF